jgi:hypothetical protein
LGITQNRRNERYYYDEDTAFAVYSAINTDPGEPSTFEEAFTGKNKEEWREAIQEELSNFAKRGVWKMINRDQVIKDLIHPNSISKSFLCHMYTRYLF